MVDLERIDACFFDLDGTIFVGDTLLPYVPSALEYLRKHGKKVMFVTNTSTQTRHDCQRRLERMGIESAVEDIITASYIAGMYFQEYDPQAAVYLIGETAMAEELDGFGITRTDNPMEATHLLVGMDTRFTYEKLYAGMKSVRNGAKLIAANPDPFCPVVNDAIPDTGAIVKAIETASGTGLHAVLGKPSAYYAEKALQQSGKQAHRCLMIGDRLETDILLGVNGGMKTALVLTGVTSMKELCNQSITPDYVLTHLGDLCPAPYTA